MKKEYILFIDSGLGGLSTLAETYKIKPGNFIYFADNKNAPYGNHSKQEIIGFLESIIIGVSKKFKLKAVVLACNTATTSSVKELRLKHKDIDIIGTEPAISLASKLGYKNILCLSTPVTARQNKFRVLRKTLPYSTRVKCHVFNDLAKDIDELFLQKSISAKFHVQKNLFKIKKISKNFDCVVLGCTHYCLLKNDIFRMTKIPIIDGNAGVSRRVFDIFHDLYSKNCKSRTVKFMFSDSSTALKQKYIKIFEQILAKT